MLLRTLSHTALEVKYGLIDGPPFLLRQNLVLGWGIIWALAQ